MALTACCRVSAQPDRCQNCSHQPVQFNCMLRGTSLAIISEPITGSSCGETKEKGILFLNQAAACLSQRASSQWTQPLYQHRCNAMGRVQCALSSLSFPEVDLPALQLWWCHRGSVKEELSERERPTDMRWMLGNAVCYGRNTEPHSG